MGALHHRSHLAAPGTMLGRHAYKELPNSSGFDNWTNCSILASL